MKDILMFVPVRCDERFGLYRIKSLKDNQSLRINLCTKSRFPKGKIFEKINRFFCDGITAQITIKEFDNPKNKPDLQSIDEMDVGGIFCSLMQMKNNSTIQKRWDSVTVAVDISEDGSILKTENVLEKYSVLEKYASLSENRNKIHAFIYAGKENLIKEDFDSNIYCIRFDTSDLVEHLFAEIFSFTIKDEIFPDGDLQNFVQTETIETLKRTVRADFFDGIILSGEKGTGKTIAAKFLCTYLKAIGKVKKIYSIDSEQTLENYFRISNNESCDAVLMDGLDSEQLKSALKIIENNKGKSLFIFTVDGLLEKVFTGALKIFSTKMDELSLRDTYKIIDSSAKMNQLVRGTWCVCSQKEKTDFVAAVKKCYSNALRFICDTMNLLKYNTIKELTENLNALAALDELTEEEKSFRITLEKKDLVTQLIFFSVLYCGKVTEEIITEFMILNIFNGNNFISEEKVSIILEDLIHSRLIQKDIGFYFIDENISEYFLKSENIGKELKNVKKILTES